MGIAGFISPALYYRDALAAIGFLERAFGFRRRFIMPDEKGGVAHAELTFRDSVIMVGSVKADQGYHSPLDLAGLHMSLSIVVSEEEIEAHYQTACDAGVRIVRPLTAESYGGRGYDARDPEGNAWYFGSYVPGAWWDGQTPV